MRAKQSIKGKKSRRKKSNKPFFAGKNPESDAADLFFAPSARYQLLEDAKHSPHQHLDSNVKTDLEQFLSTSLGSVRVHNNAESHKASEHINAKAYASGDHIFLGREAGALSSQERKSLLAHEAVHTVQQRSLSTKAIQPKLLIGEATTPHEREADQLSGAFMRLQKENPYAPVKLKQPIKTLTAPVIQRSVKTSGGTWSTDQYEVKKDEINGVKQPTAYGIRGADIKLRFTPGTEVDAQQIGLSQTVQAIVGGAASFVDDIKKKRSVSAADAIRINTGKGETDAGTSIDRVSKRRNPIYGTENTRSGGGSAADLSSYDAGGNNQFGYHYMNGKAVKKRSAWLYDAPRRPNASTNSRHIFEATAIATKGKQKNEYYGSVRWGWRTDSAGEFTKIPLSVVSQGAPSSTFMKAGQLWNSSKDDSGKPTVKLPLVDVKVVTSPITLMPGIPYKNIVLPAGTRIKITGQKDYKIKVVDGPLIGKQGTVKPMDYLFKLKNERA